MHRTVFEAVWGHEEAGKIVKRFQQKYDEHNRTRGPGEEFVAVFYCRSGMHQSVATVVGLQTLMRVKEDIVVSVLHCNKDEYKKRCSTCSECGPVEGRSEWELSIARGAMKDR